MGYVTRNISFETAAELESLGIPVFVSGLPEHVKLQSILWDKVELISTRYDPYYVETTSGMLSRKDFEYQYPNYQFSYRVDEDVAVAKDTISAVFQSLDDILNYKNYTETAKEIRSLESLVTEIVLREN